MKTQRTFNGKKIQWTGSGYYRYDEIDQTWKPCSAVSAKDWENARRKVVSLVVKDTKKVAK